MSKTLDLNALFLIGYAGQGKDTIRTFLENHYDNSFFQISFAETLKRQVGLMLSDEQLELAGTRNRTDAVNILKDEHPGYSVYNGFDMRKFLQLIGTEFYRDSINTDIHVKYVAQKMLNILSDSEIKNPLFVSCDTRFPNEYSFGVNFGEIKDLDLKKDFLKFFISRNINEITMPELKEIFFRVFNVQKEDDFSKGYLDIVYNDLKQIRPDYNTQYDWSEKLDYPKSIKGFTIQESLNNSMFHIFRPILNPEIKYNEDLKPSKLIEAIKEYTGLPVDKILKIKDYYEISKLDFSVENINKVGFARANVSHYSETALNHLKPLPFLSTPMYNKDLAKAFEIRLLEIFDAFTLEKKSELLNKNKNKNENNKLKFK